MVKNQRNRIELVTADLLASMAILYSGGGVGLVAEHWALHQGISLVGGASNCLSGRQMMSR